MFFEILINDAAGWIIVLLLLGGVLFFKEYREDKGLLVVYWFVLSLHIAVSVANAYFFSTLGTSGDAVKFYETAISLSSSKFSSSLFSMAGQNYEHILGLIFRVFGASLFLGQQLSIIAFTLSFFVLAKFIKMLELWDYRISILLVFGSLPSMVFFGSITLRESYEILFFILSVYLIFRYYDNQGLKYLFGGIICAFAMGIFHYGLLFYAICLTFSVLLLRGFWTNNKMSFFLTNKRYLFIFLGALCVVVFLIGFFEKNIIIDRIINGRLAYFINDSRTSSYDSRAYYGILLDTTSVFGFFKSLFLMLVYYLFSPFPWQITTMKDCYGLVESVVRLVLIIFSFNLWFNAKGFNRHLITILLSLYFSMAFMWAVGTVNYGTLIRHNIVHFWIIALIGVPGFIRFFKSKIKFYNLKYFFVL